MDDAFYATSGEIKDGVRDLSEQEGRPLTNSVLQLVNLNVIDDRFRELVERPSIVDAVRNLLASEVLVFRDQAFYKPALHGGEVYLHQDNRYWHLEPPNAVTVWIAIDPATEDNGCLRYILGSHVVGRVHHSRAASGRSILLEADWDKNSAVPFEVPAGHALVHHCQTLHWSAPNLTSRPRRAHTIEYVSEGVLAKGTPVKGKRVVVPSSTYAL
jgi:2-oxoglutarate-dependent dioxygenase